MNDTPSIILRYETGPSWVEAVMDDFDAFLLDHAACERKASATALSLVVKYPDRREILEPLIRLAREELAHFHRVFQFVLSRNLVFERDEKDSYVNQMLRLRRVGDEPGLLDRLLLFGIIECRGCERFGLVAEALSDPTLKAFYLELTESESRHAGQFVDFALNYFPKTEVLDRMNVLLDIEADIVRSLPIRPALH